MSWQLETWASADPELRYHRAEDEERIRQAFAAVEWDCADCGQPLIYHPARFAYVHKDRPADDHAPRPVKR